MEALRKASTRVSAGKKKTAKATLPDEDPRKRRSPCAPWPVGKKRAKG